jgi:hypothetical protein
MDNIAHYNFSIEKNITEEIISICHLN